MTLGKCILFVLVVAGAVARPQDETEEETDTKQSFQSAQHLKFDGDVVLQPDDTVITTDRIRALLRSGFSAVRLGNKTLASLNQQKHPPEAPPNITASTPVPTTPTSPPPTTISSGEEESEEDTTETDEPTSLVTLPRTKHPAVTDNHSIQTTTISESGLVTETPTTDDQDTTLESTQKPTKRIYSSPKTTPETEDGTEITPTAKLQAQFKRIKSATIHDGSDDVSGSTDTPLDDTTDRQEPTTVSVLSQIVRGSASLSPPSPPPSPFEHSRKQPGSAKTRKLTTPSPDGDEAEATIPFEETTTTTTTTEAPMPPALPDYVPASKQLSPFVSGVKSLDSGSTRDALDAASQMGKLTWLVNYYENAQQTGQVGLGQ